MSSTPERESSRQMSPKCEIEPRVFKQRTLEAAVFGSERAVEATERQVTRRAAGGATHVSGKWNHALSKLS